MKKILKSEITKLKEKLDAQEEVIDFLSSYNREDVIFDIPSRATSIFDVPRKCIIIIKYLYNKKLHSVEFKEISYYSNPKVIMNKEKEALIKVESGLGSARFFVLNKATEAVAELSSDVRENISTPSSSEAIKYSSEAIKHGLQSESIIKPASSKTFTIE